ncbi:MAG: helix-turn-helix domain-containing protein [Nevskiaceae bacterium]|jgi:DNA-binding winged helix-turn-helix (wHTH) protein|nr:helix-turn-helix domain-containing protein [Nevskiaceae bacterium]
MSQRFHEWEFSGDLLTARSDAGQELRFTRQERAVLVELLAKPGSLVTRQRLLEVLPRQDGKDTDGSERQVDYLITRLRRHLDDTARKPRFIATHYGDGYRWIAPVSKPPDAPDSAFLVIQPLHRHMPPAADALVRTLCEVLRERIRPPNSAPASVAIAPLPPWRPDPGSFCAFILEISTWTDDTALHAALLLRDARTRQPVYPLRITHPLSRGHGQLAVQGKTEAIASDLLPRIWAHQALNRGEAPTDLPLELRLHEATRLFGEPLATWRESLAYADQLDHGVHQAAVRDVVRAMALLTRIILQSPRTQCLTPQEWDEHEAEIERLVIPHLDAIAGQPLLELAAARLLNSIGGRHAQTALQLAQSGFAGTTAFAAALPTLAQCHVHAGDFAIADALYERSLELAEPGSQFHIYLLTLRCLACLGSGDREALARCRAELFAVHPPARQDMGFLLHSPDPELPPDIAAVLPRLPENILRLMVYFVPRSTRRLFGNPEHQANLLRGFAAHLARYMGPHVLSDELRALIAG